MKHSYHTDIAVQYKLGILDSALVAKIPSSTLHNWKKRDFSLLVGTGYVTDFEQNLQMIRDFLSKKYLLNAAKAIYFVYSSCVAILNSIKNRDKIFRQSRGLIISTIDRVKDSIGFKRALRTFGISYQQYYAWKKKAQCTFHFKTKILLPNIGKTTFPETCFGIARKHRFLFTRS